MILVESIKYIEVPDDIWEIIHMRSAYDGIEVLTAAGERVVATNLIMELVRGRRFRRPSDGTDIMIGWSEDVQRLLGIPMECWENQEKDRNQLIEENNRFKNASFWQRFKWLFTGVK